MKEAFLRSVTFFAGRTAVFISLAFLLYALVQIRHEILSISFTIEAAVSLFLVIVLAVFANTIAAFAWGNLIPDETQRISDNNTTPGQNKHQAIPFITIFRIWSQSGLLKYIPGSIFQYVSRYSLASKAGIPPQKFFASLTLEVFFVSASAVGLILLGYAVGSFSGVELEFFSNAHLSDNFVLVVLVLATVIAIPIYRLARFLVRKFSSTLASITLQMTVRSIACYMALYFLSGLSSLILLEMIWHIDMQINLLALSSGFALAFILGYLTPGAPGGIGVRELVMVAIFSPSFGKAPIIGMVIVLRLAAILSDFIVYILAVAVADNSSIDENNHP